ncbi:CXADR-like membrane protein [Conger conger]|uniref:CXADR-like membrane protein n=1 Tax=Conger conger TaxID=82655 RepID=UPI002A5A4A69|nr:CXADR-like membrane protein [Conger conger]
MMAVGAISFIIVLLLVIPSVSSPVLSATDSSLSIVEGRFGDSVTLPCDGSARHLPDDQLDVLWKTDQKTVAHYSGGKLVVDSHFSGRVTFPTERILRRDFSIDISSVKSSDEGKYECVVKNEHYLKDVQLKVLPPLFSRSLSVAVNDLVTLPCYGGVHKYEPDKLFVQWERGGDLVLKFSSKELICGPKYEGRVSVSPDWRDGNFSLSLSVTGLRDSGVYQCSSDQKHNVASVVLEVNIIHSDNNKLYFLIFIPICILILVVYVGIAKKQKIHHVKNKIFSQCRWPRNQSHSQEQENNQE